jgi:protein-tyrosine phosphatase
MSFADRGGKKAYVRSLAYASVAIAGGARRYRRIAWPRVERLVFVCKGNICRSPFAEAVARARGFRTASFGLDATAGLPADADAIRIAREFSVDLDAHRTTPATGMVLGGGDLVVGFEPWHLAGWVGPTAGEPVWQSTLLGVWLRPPNLYVHDPYGTSSSYFRNCYRRIVAGVETLIEHVPRRP